MSASNTNIKISYEDEVSHSEELKSKIELLKSATENLQSKYFEKDSEVNDLEHKNDHLLKENYRIDELLKSFKKEAKEIKEKSDQTARRQEKKIQELMKFKMRKISEEKEIRKIDHTAPLGIEVPKIKHDENRNKTDVHSEALQTISIPTEYKFDPLDEPPYEVDSAADTPRDSTCLESTTSLDAIGLDTTYLGTTSMNNFTVATTQVNSPSTKPLFPPWTCQICQADIPLGRTWEQTLHMKKHRDEPKA